MCVLGSTLRCGPGTTSTLGSAYCVECSAGTFLDESRDPPVCAECAAGEVSKNAASECTPCKPGLWQNGTASSIVVLACAVFSNDACVWYI